MKRAILIGNGVTSQLIDDYKDNNMIEKVKKELGDLYFEIDNLLDPYRKLEIKDEYHICKLLEKSNIELHHYKRYFIDQSLLLELNYPHITAIETLLKVAHLFHHIKKFDYNEIKSCSNRIYYNNGMNGLDNIKIKEFDIEKFKSFINKFEYVFTTNFDNILDDAYSGDIYHLHGGFRYRRYKVKGSIFISKEKEDLEPEKAHLIWGRNFKEKKEQTTGGICWPTTFPMGFGMSIIDEHFRILENGLFEEIHIWGYSGLNDNHINQSISKNKNLKRIYCYVCPNDLASDSISKKMENLYNFEGKNTIVIKSWDEIWNILKK